jgi:DNA polymerase (family 10)
VKASGIFTVLRHYCGRLKSICAAHILTSSGSPRPESFAGAASSLQTYRWSWKRRELPATPSPPVAIRLTDTAHYGATLLYATGSQAHIAELESLAKDKGLTLDKHGLRRSRKIIARKSEQEIYAALGLPYIEPELREGRDEITHGLNGKMPTLVTDADIRGILHVHTDRSDGVNKLDVMAEATRKRGYHYLGIADHSKSAHYARGLMPEEIAEQHGEIDRLNRHYDGVFRIFKGIESDILGDGSLDYPEDILASFGFVVASVHSWLRFPRAEQTERILRAVANPFTTILGHMTGRQLLRRPGADVDIERVLKKCAQHCVAVEINANPWRLDLDWRWHRRALDLGCLLSIDPDAHSTDEIDLVHWVSKWPGKAEYLPAKS